MARLAGKVVLITGSTGIAEATARLAAAEGARVFVTSRTASHCRDLAASVGGAFEAADLTEPASADRVMAACLAQYGRLDAIYNVVGISGRRLGDGPLHELSDEGWDATLSTNLTSMFRMCRAAVRHWLGQPVEANGLRGTILNMASVLGFSPEPRHFAAHAYSASKAAIIGFSRALASYYAPHKIRVNVIAPALVRTPMSRRAQENPEILQAMRTRQPLAEGMIEPGDVARASVFLLSDDSRMVTADVLTVDAGWCVSA